MPTDQNGEEKEGYRFIQEKVVPSKRKRWKKLLSMAGMAVVMGAVFGLTAATTFCMAEPWIAERLGLTDGEQGTPVTEDERVHLPEDQGADGEREDMSAELGAPSDPQEGDQNETSGQKTDEVDQKAETDPSGEDGIEDVAGTEPEEGREPVIMEQRIAGDLTDFKNMFDEISQMATEANKSIVRVASVTSGIDWFQNPYETEASTSGMILATDEKLIYILTTYRIIGQANEIRVTFNQNLSATATFQDADPDMDLAIITVDKSALPKRVAQELQAAPLGESYSLRIGDPVMALGDPNGVQNSMLFGMVTSRDSYVYVADDKLTLFHTDMQLAEEGHGFIFNMDGKVVGIITRSLSEEKDSCTALAISRVKTLLEKLMNQTPRAYLGVIGIDLSESLSEKLDVVGGVYVSEVVNGSPAALAGIRAGDVILQVDENSVFTMLAFSTYLQEQTPGETVSLKICRMVREEAITSIYEVTLGEKGN